MFLLQSLLVLSFAYWSAAIVAEVVLSSEQEQRMPAAIRAALGLLLLTTYFSAAWQLVSMRQSWILGILLLALYGVGNWPRVAAARGFTGFKHSLAAHLRGYAACLAAGLLFFAPLLVANNYGPFTEGGGDVTIYSDTAKLLTDNDMTSFGQPSTDLRNVEPNVKSLFNLKDTNRYVRYAHVKDAFVNAHRQKWNPPIADSAAYRTVADIFFSSVFYAPYAQFYFLSRDTNYPVFYGVQALFYAFMLSALWYFFGRFGVGIAVLAVSMTIASHGLISVFYNTYSMQAISLSISALILYLVVAIRIFSIAGCRAFGFGSLIVWLCYTHYVSIIAPLLLAAAAAAFMSRDVRSAPETEARISLPRQLLKALPLLVLAALVVLLIVGGSGKSIEFVTGLLNTFLQGAKSVYLGDRISLLSFDWLSFLFGFVSQQHLQPFAIEVPWVMKLIKVGIVLGVVSALLGIATLGKVRREQSPGKGIAVYLMIYWVIVGTVAGHVYMAQSSLYTQAKGTQNVLALFYAAIVLPFAVGFALRNREGTLKTLVGALGTALILFTCALLVPRAVYTYKLAHGMDRGAILERSYFEAAQRIREADANAFVLFEPRKSADLYVSIQPFAGMRMVPRRHQALDQVIPFGAKVGIIASDLLGAHDDVPHLWTLSSVKDAGGGYVWQAKRVADSTEPTLYLFGDDYEQNFGERQRGADPADLGMFSYLRNGSAMLYLPAGQPCAVEVKLAPRESEAFRTMLEEVRRRLSEGEFPASARLQEDGKFITLSYQLDSIAAPRMIVLARFSGEYWLNVRLNGKEPGLKQAPALKEVSGAEKVAGVLVKGASGGFAVQVSWSGIRTPNKEDWIGVFPVGGSDATRIAFVFLGGKTEGSAAINLPADHGDQSLEVRLYRAGSWESMASSPPIATQQ